MTTEPETGNASPDADPGAKKRRRWKIALMTAAALIVAGIITSTQICLFVVRPIETIPNGVTLVLWKGEKMKFIDSVEAVCERERGGVTLLCRGSVLVTLAKNNDKRIAMLPYSETLYRWSTGGAKYARD